MFIRQLILAVLVGTVVAGRVSPQPAGATVPATAPSAPTTAPATRALRTNAAGEIVISFDGAAVGKAVPSWTAGAVTFTLAAAPQRSRAQGRVMFFPHLKTGRQGILNAMANEQGIPVKAQITGGASSVTLVLWGTVGCRAWVEAFNPEGKLVDRAALADTVPRRKSPSEPIPSFELTVKGDRIAYVHYGGAIEGGAIVADEVRYLPVRAAPAEQKCGSPNP
jgi:hypothetical protein